MELLGAVTQIILLEGPRTASPCLGGFRLLPWTVCPCSGGFRLLLLTVCPCSGGVRLLPQRASTCLGRFKLEPQTKCAIYFGLSNFPLDPPELVLGVFQGSVTLLNRAFDMVDDHSILLLKLSRYGVNDIELK